jgi:hypothetical protein
MERPPWVKRLIAEDHTPTGMRLQDAGPFRIGVDRASSVDFRESVPYFQRTRVQEKETH